MQKQSDATNVANDELNEAALAELPPPNIGRWVARRKAQVVMAVRRGLLSEKQALKRWNISEEEFRAWERLIEGHGERGLRVTRTQHYR